MYITRGRTRSSLVKIGWVVSSRFKLLKFCSQVPSQANLADFFSSLIIGLVLYANFGRKLEMAVSLPTSRCTSLTFMGLLMSIIAWHFSRLASIPRCLLLSSRFLFFWETGLALRKTDNLWEATLGCMPGRSAADQAKRSTFRLRICSMWCSSHQEGWCQFGGIDSAGGMSSACRTSSSMRDLGAFKRA